MRRTRRTKRFHSQRKFYFYVDTLLEWRAEAPNIRDEWQTKVGNRELLMNYNEDNAVLYWHAFMYKTE